MGRLYFMIDNARETREKILKGILPPYILYGGIQLEKERKVEIREYAPKEILNLKRGDIVITNRLKHVFLMRAKGIKVVLINMNSNHDLVKNPSMNSEQSNPLAYLSFFQTKILVPCYFPKSHSDYSTKKTIHQ